MRLNEFLSMIKPFINIRGGDVIYPQQSLHIAINNGIQDIYNYYDWQFLTTTLTIKEEDYYESGQGYYIVDLPPTKRFINFKTYDESGFARKELKVETTIPDLLDGVQDIKDSNSVMIANDKLYSFSKPTGVLTYKKNYQWNLFPQDTTIELPLPNKFIPSLYYLVLSQIDLIEVMQADSQTYSNYGKYANKIKTLAETEPSMVSSITGYNRD